LDIPCPTLEAINHMKDVDDNVRTLRVVVRDRDETDDPGQPIAPGSSEKVVTTALLHRLLIRRILVELIEAEDACEVERHGSEPNPGGST
jgi:hypothetical protein